MNVDPGKSRFFIALLPPQAIQAYATEVIQELGDRFQMRTSKAPPHITLQAPFQWSLEQVPALEQCLAEFAERRQSSVPIRLSGFGAFAPRVLYIHVEKTSELLTLQKKLGEVLEATLDIVDPQSKRRSFTPHLTVASRNVMRSTFKQAWADLQSRSVEFEFVGDRLTLLIHNGQRWLIHAEFPLTH
jgi:2'-5' RNA ligase